MQDKRNDLEQGSDALIHPLKTLTAEQFAALGGSAVVFVRSVTGESLGSLLHQDGFDNDETYQLVMSADGTPLFVTDSDDSLSEWLSGGNYGIVQVH